MKKIALFFLSIIFIGCASGPSTDDPYLWLEEIEGEKALNWVKKRNSSTLRKFKKSKRFRKMNRIALKLLEDKDKIPYVDMKGKYVYNFWRDGDHVRGLWRRTTFKSYRRKRPKWETVLDVDKLAKREGQNWVYQYSTCLAPKYERCLISLSKGGKDASVVREFSTKTKKFIKSGFKLPEAKSRVAWYDKNRIFVATNFGEDSLTDSGYPHTVKLWKRRSNLSSAQTIYTGKTRDMMSSAHTFFTSEGKVSVIERRENFYKGEAFLYKGGELQKIPKPDGAEIVGYFKGHFLLQLRSLWEVGDRVFESGSVVAMDEEMAGGEAKDGSVDLIYEPGDKSSVLFVSTTKDFILINVLENVKGRIYGLTVDPRTAKFTELRALNHPTTGHVTVSATSPFVDNFFFRYRGFLSPESLFFYEIRKRKHRRIKSLAHKFSSRGMVVQQHWAKSKDGTKVPYFLIGKGEVVRNGMAPTLLYGYGGFEISRTPSYSPITGKLWLEKGGVYVVANIRGGGEFGPRWHQAALKKNRQKAFDDFIAVAEDLIKRKVTAEKKLAIQGGSNGGLLVGAVMTQRPELFNGVLCQVPLLDMLRYSQLLAGASWMAEYGDPRKSSMKEYLLSYSPYHNIDKDKKYPPMFLMTSTKDDRVHPGHARKMAARMLSFGKSVYYYENTEGGHAASANLKQKAKMTALSYAFLFKTIF